MTCFQKLFQKEAFGASASGTERTFTIRDLWLKKDIGNITAGGLTIAVGANGSSKLLKITPNL
jgi:hypothetical protein